LNYSTWTPAALRLALSLLLAAAAALPLTVRAQGAEGWYAQGTSLMGPASSKAEACEMGGGMFKGMQAAQNPNPGDFLTTFAGVSGEVCNWETVAGPVGPYGTVGFYPSAYFPLAPYAPQMNAGECCPQEGNPIIPVTGNKFQVEPDYSAAGPLGLAFVRYYNSFAADGRVAGFSDGWTHTYSARLVRDGTNMVAIRPDGKGLRFTLTGGSYVADGTAVERLERVTTPSLGWKLTTSSDEVETYDDPGALLAIADRAGLTQTLVYTAGKLSSVTDPYGRTLTIARGAYDRIQSVTTPTGVISYAYGSDLTGNLVSVTYPGPATRTYHYEHTLPTKLTGITDENGERFSTYGYDSAGRATSTEHAGGANKVTIVHDGSTGTRNTVVTRHRSPTASA
jgi:YD repeat-containing protein